MIYTEHHQAYTHLPLSAGFLQIENAIKGEDGVLERPDVHAHRAQVFPHLPVLKLSPHGLLERQERPRLVASLDKGVGEVVPALKVLV